MAPIPVLVLTGFLGSGKTTLINRILSEQHGRRLAVIENEFGEVGVDNDLVLGADEEIFEMNNGCLCCTVRGDLIRILGNLARRKNPVDLVVIETTGLADPGPVAQTFFMDDEVKERYRLMGIVTVVDAFHCGPHLDQSPEASRQVAFADLLLVNKVDLVKPADLVALKGRLRGINAVAPQIDTQMAALELNHIWDLAGFSLDRALGLDSAFLEVERPFESALPLPSGRPLELRWTTGPDPRALALVQAGAEPRVDEADAVFQGLAAPFVGTLAEGVLTSLDLQAPGSLVVELAHGQTGWLFFEHHPDEFGLELWVDGHPHPWDGARFYRPNHEHDDVTSVGLTSRRPLDPKKFQLWLSSLLATQGADLYRSKGILYLKGSGLKQVFQGVHMLLTGGDLGPWGDQVPETRMVFIGRDLDRRALTEGFERCLV